GAAIDRGSGVGGGVSSGVGGGSSAVGGGVGSRGAGQRGVGGSLVGCFGGVGGGVLRLVLVRAGGQAKAQRQRDQQLVDAHVFNSSSWIGSRRTVAPRYQ